jgi:integrase
MNYSSIDLNSIKMNESIHTILLDISESDISTLEKLLTFLKEKKVPLKNAELDLNKFSAEYFNYIQTTFSPKYLKSVKLTYKHLIDFFSGGKILSEINNRDAENFKQHLMKNAPDGFRIYIRNLRASFNCAIEWEYIDKNPFNGLKIKKRQLSKPNYLDKKSFIKIIEKANNKNLVNLFYLCFLTGIRLGEATNLKWLNFDFSKNTLAIGGEKFETKNHNTRIIPLCNELIKIFKPNFESSENKYGYCFSKKGGYKYTEEYISRYFKKCCKLANIDSSITFHSLRHSFCTLLLENGVPIHTVKELAGHSSIIVTQIYAHSNIASKKDAIKKLENYITKNTKGKSEQFSFNL